MNEERILNMSDVDPTDDHKSMGNEIEKTDKHEHEKKHGSRFPDYLKQVARKSRAGFDRIHNELYRRVFGASVNFDETKGHRNGGNPTRTLSLRFDPNTSQLAKPNKAKRTTSFRSYIDNEPLYSELRPPFESTATELLSTLNKEDSFRRRSYSDPLILDVNPVPKPRRKPVIQKRKTLQQGPSDEIDSYIKVDPFPSRTQGRSRLSESDESLYVNDSHVIFAKHSDPSEDYMYQDYIGFDPTEEFSKAAVATCLTTNGQNRHIGLDLEKCEKNSKGAKPKYGSIPEEPKLCKTTLIHAPEGVPEEALHYDFILHKPKPVFNQPYPVAHGTITQEDSPLYDQVPVRPSTANQTGKPASIPKQPDNKIAPLYANSPSKPSVAKSTPIKPTAKSKETNKPKPAKRKTNTPAVESSDEHQYCNVQDWQVKQPPACNEQVDLYTMPRYLPTSKKSFYNFTVEEVVKILKLSALDSLAVVCQKEALCGNSFRGLTETELKQKPFSLNQSQITKLNQIFNGLRPREMS